MVQMTIQLEQLSSTTTEATVRAHRVLIDRPVDKGGTDLGPMGGELFLAAIGGCFMSNLLAAIRARNADVSDVRTTVIGTIAPAPARFAAVEVQVEAKGGSEEIQRPCRHRRPRLHHDEHTSRNFRREHPHAQRVNGVGSASKSTWRAGGADATSVRGERIIVDRQSGDRAKLLFPEQPRCQLIQPCSYPVVILKPSLNVSVRRLVPVAESQVNEPSLRQPIVASASSLNGVSRRVERRQGFNETQSCGTTPVRYGRLTKWP